MKRFVMLLVFLAVANSFPLKNEENAALKTKVMFYHKSFNGNLVVESNQALRRLRQRANTRNITFRNFLREIDFP